MDERNEKTMGMILILVGISMWKILPASGMSFRAVLLVHMLMVIPGVYLFERPFIKYLCGKIKKR